jgi:hypothetical protein
MGGRGHGQGKGSGQVAVFERLMFVWLEGGWISGKMEKPRLGQSLGLSRVSQRLRGSEIEVPRCQGPLWRPALECWLMPSMSLSCGRPVRIGLKGWVNWRLGPLLIGVFTPGVEYNECGCVCLAGAMPMVGHLVRRGI